MNQCIINYKCNTKVNYVYEWITKCKMAHYEFKSLDPATINIAHTN
jgi:hypothetical protein